MKYLYPAAAFILFVFFVSCDGKAENKESLAAPVLPFSTNPVLPANNVSPAKNDSPAVASTVATKAEVALNPQHGQPGHRCDIAVGQPLNTPATSIQPNVLATAPTTNAKVDSPKVSAKSSTPTAGMNPKHGEPGHRCDIAVGAPLNSPATTNIQPNLSATAPTTNTKIDSPKALAKASTTTAGMNPKHGEPGHRCDIAVGAPLNSKPAQ